MSIEKINKEIIFNDYKLILEGKLNSQEVIDKINLLCKDDRTAKKLEITKLKLLLKLKSESKEKIAKEIFKFEERCGGLDTEVLMDLFILLKCDFEKCPKSQYGGAFRSSSMALLKMAVFKSLIGYKKVKTNQANIFKDNLSEAMAIAFIEDHLPDTYKWLLKNQLIP